MKSALATLMLGVAGLIALTMAPMAAKAAGETQDCIRLRDISDSPTIDDKTILLKMRAAHQFKRIDLLNSCPGIAFSGFARSSPEDKFCRTDTLKVLELGGMNCKIDKIVTIDEAEAKTLQAKR